MILYVWLAVVGRTDGWVGHFDVSFIICLLLKENRIGYLVFVLVVMAPFLPTLVCLFIEQCLLSAQGSKISQKN